MKIIGNNPCTERWIKYTRHIGSKNASSQPTGTSNMITTVALYVALCSSPTTCDEYVPATWTASSQEELSQVYEQCAKEEQTYMSFKGYKESDCYVINTTN